jgi:hypothetical protein
MTPETSQPPKALLEVISRDMQPVKPLPVPSRVAIRAAVLAVLAVIAVLVVEGLRRDVAKLGPVLSWGASAAQLGFGLLLVWIAARESTPGRRLPTRFVRLAAVAAVMIVLAVTWWTFAMRPIVIPARFSAWRLGWLCGSNGAIAGALLMILFVWLFRHSLAARPAVAGALYGAGAGIAVNSGWRLSCPVSAPSHSLGAHGAPILFTTLLGSLAAYLISKWLRRATR